MTAPSTPAPQDQTELDEYLRVVADCANLEVALARERESRTQAEVRVDALENSLRRLRDCDWVISLPDRMDAVRDIARAALATPLGTPGSTE